MNNSENDCRLALSIAKLLGVELDPWQERMLQALLASHREPVPKVRFTNTPSPSCGALSDSSGGGPASCARSTGHAGRHRGVPFAMNSPIEWDDMPCGAAHPVPGQPSCPRRLNHAGPHEVARMDGGIDRWFYNGGLL